ncbi:MAG: cytochrome c-type biogenesis protein [Gammaproteobacteria bacterium]
MIKPILMLALLAAGPCLAGVEVREFADPEQERTYRMLIGELRCLVCQNQNIADSNADLAKDLRRQVYEMVRDGKTARDVAEYMRLRYGDFILYRPQFRLKTGLLWVAPFVFLTIGLIAVAFYVKRRQGDAGAMALTVEEKRKIRSLLDGDDAS